MFCGLVVIIHARYRDSQLAAAVAEAAATAAEANAVEGMDEVELRLPAKSGDQVSLRRNLAALGVGPRPRADRQSRRAKSPKRTTPTSISAPGALRLFAQAWSCGARSGRLHHHGETTPRGVCCRHGRDRGSEEELVAMASPQSRGVAWMADPDALEAAGQTTRHKAEDRGSCRSHTECSMAVRLKFTSDVYGCYFTLSHIRF